MIVQIIFVIMAIVVLIALYILIAKLEERNKISKLKNEADYLIYLSIGILLIFSFLFYSLYQNQVDKTQIIFIAIFLKIVMSFVVLGFATKQNRNPFLWFILGLIEFHSALIALGLSKYIFQNSSKLKEKGQKLKKEYKEKLKVLEELDKNNQISFSDYREKNRNLILEYDNNVKELINQKDNDNTLKEQDNKIQIVKNAYDMGILSEEEYNKKIEEIEKSKL